jgi:hypothetical protein
MPRRPRFGRDRVVSGHGPDTAKVKRLTLTGHPDLSAIGKVLGVF